MGACCGGRTYTDNEAENFIRETIYNIKLKYYNYDEVNKAYLDFVTIEKRNNEEVHEVNEGKYNKFTKDYYYIDDVAKNAYARYQLAAIPTALELQEKAPKYVILINALSLIHGKDKHRALFHVFKSNNFNAFDVDHFNQLIFYYLDTNLRLWTERIVAAIKNTKEKVVIDNYTIDADFKKTAGLLLDHFTLSHIEAIESLVRNDFEAIVLKNHRQAKAGTVKHEKVTEEDLEQLYDRHPWLFDALELRDYYWNHYVLKHSA